MSLSQRCISKSWKTCTKAVPKNLNSFCQCWKQLFNNFFLETQREVLDQFKNLNNRTRPPPSSQCWRRVGTSTRRNAPTSKGWIPNYICSNCKMYLANLHFIIVIKFKSRTSFCLFLKVILTRGIWRAARAKKNSISPLRPISNKECCDAATIAERWGAVSHLQVVSHRCMTC